MSSGLHNSRSLFFTKKQALCLTIQLLEQNLLIKKEVQVDQSDSLELVPIIQMKTSRKESVSSQRRSSKITTGRCSKDAKVFSSQTSWEPHNFQFTEMLPLQAFHFTGFYCISWTYKNLRNVWTGRLIYSLETNWVEFILSCKVYILWCSDTKSSNNLPNSTQSDCHVNSKPHYML